MAVSLGFHIVFAEIGIAMPLMMVLAEWRWQRTGERAYLDLAQRWAKGTAVLFAVGAVSGTVLSFELGLLWPAFMRQAGPLIGIPFSLEGFAFFLEAIFLGIYLYGWERVGPRVHLGAGLVVAASGAASAVFVVLVNAWMNTPTGFTLDAAGAFASIDPVAAMRSPAAFQQALHMLLAAYAATGMAVAGVHALMLLRGAAHDFHRHALTVALLVGAPAAVLQPLSGDVSARVVATTQPVKLAALEGQWATMRGAPLRIGGWPDAAREETRWALEIPHGLSLLAFHDPSAEVKGLRAVPVTDRPPVAVVHLAFQAMVALGSALALIALCVVVIAVRGRPIAGRKLREQILKEMRSKAAGAAAPYNLLYRPTQDGVATTYAGFVAAALGIRDLEHITPQQQAEIQRGHLLLAFANAMQPGIFSLSAWDLVGALPLPRASVEKRMADGDCRWINRGAVDLLDTNPDAQKSTFGIPRARVLYGPLPDQFKNANSFAMQLKRILAVRKKYHIEQAELIAAPETDQSAVCILVMRVPDQSVTIVTALNFSREAVHEQIDLQAIKELKMSKFAGTEVFNCMAELSEGTVSVDGAIKLELEPWSGKVFSIDGGSETKSATDQSQ